MRRTIDAVPSKRIGARVSVENEPRLRAAPRHGTRSAVLREGFAGLAATVMTAIAPALVVTSYAFATVPAQRGTAFMAFWIVFFVAFAHAIVLGVPAALVLVHRGMFRLLPMCAAGAVAGFVPAFALAAASAGVWSEGLAVAGIGAGLGAWGGCAFYVTYRAVSGDHFTDRSPPRDIA